MNLNHKIYLLPLALLLGACSSPTPTTPFKITTSVPVTNTKLSSGSGAVIDKHQLVVVGDDEPWLFDVDVHSYSIKNKELIKSYPLNTSGRIDKSVKPDFEAMSTVTYLGSKHYLILGSGSKSTRRSAFLIDIVGKNKKTLDLKPLYKQLYAVSGFKSKQHINIEGVATTENKIFIFNRGNSGTNIIFEMDLNQFFAFIDKQSSSLSSLKTFFVTLPKIDGVESTLSGVDYWPQANSLIISASVEGKSDAINDGKVLGSFVGVLPISALESNNSSSNTLSLSPYMQLLKKQNKVVITKIEAVAIDSSTNHSASGYFVSDNDNGTSQFIHFNIEQ